METSQAAATDISSEGGTEQSAPPWSLRSALKAPELWLIVALAAVLRLWHIGVSLFLADQAELMRMARLSLHDGLIPVTGIPSSIGTLNPPASIFVLLPFAALGSDPLPAVIGTALWNVVGVGLAYVFARRYFNRMVAIVTALLFAAGGAAVAYSRFIWQQNLLPPVVLVWAICAFAGATRERGRRLWLAPAVGCALIATQLHPTAAIFFFITVIALLLAPSLPRRLDWLLTAVFVVVLLLPTLIFEKLNGGYDLRQLQIYGSQGAHVDLSVGRALWGILDGPDMHNLSGQGLAHELTSPAGLVTLALGALIAAGYVLLTARVFRPAWRVWRGMSGPHPLTPSPAGEGEPGIHIKTDGLIGLRRIVARGRALWSSLRSDSIWKANLLLWLWITVPILALVRHSSLVADHYLMTLYPAIFIPAALLVARVWASSSPHARLHAGASVGPRPLTPSPTGEREPNQAVATQGSFPVARGKARGNEAVAARPNDHLIRRSRRSLPLSSRERGLGGEVISLLLLALVAALVIGQAARDLGYYSRLASGSFNQFATYGYPLDALRTLNQRLDTLARQTRARSVEIVDPDPRFDPKIIEYMLVDGRPDRLSFGGGCLILPAPSAGPILIAASPSGQPALDALTRLAGASHLANISMAGTAAWSVYEYAPASASSGLPGDHSVVQATFRDSAGNAFRLDAAARDGGMLRLRWTPLSRVNPPYGAQLGVSVWASAGGQTVLGGCQTQRWQMGQTFYTWLPLPASGSSASDSVKVWAGDQILGPKALTFAGLHLLTGFYFHHDTRGLYAQPASDSGLVSPETIQPDGSYILPLSALAG